MNLVEPLLLAQKKSWEIFSKIQNELKLGMTEENARELALAIFAESGVTEHWHRPTIRFGAGTALTFLNPLQADYRLQANDPVFIDLGPVWSGKSLGTEIAYEGDVGDTFIMGENPEAKKCAVAVRTIFNEVSAEWRTQGLTGQQIFKSLQRKSEEHELELVEQVSGHRLSDFPHQQYTRERLFHLNFTPAPGEWILEVQLVHPSKKFGAFFEDLLI